MTDKEGRDMELVLAIRKISIPFILLLLILMTLNQWQIFSKAQSELEEEIAAIDSLKLKQETIKNFTENKNLLADSINSLQYMIPSNKEHSDLLGYLNSLFIKHNIQINYLEFSDHVEKEDFNEIPINISLKGQYNEVVNLLNEFRMGNRPLRIDELHIDIGDGSSIVHCDILAYAFLRETAE